MFASVGVLSTVWHRDDIYFETAVPSVLTDLASVSVPVRTVVFGGARPFSVPLRGWDRGEVMQSWTTFGEGREKRSWPRPT